MSKIKNKYDKSIDEYIEISKGDITLYVILSIICVTITGYFLINENIGNWLFVFLIVFTMILPIRSIEKIVVHFNLKKIKKHLEENNLLDKIGKIEFYNEQDYFLTEKYMIIYRDKVVDSFEYSEIKSIQKEYKHKIGKNSETKNYLHITLRDNRKYRILTFSTVLVNEDYRDISDNLLKKNPKIEVLKDITKIN